MKMRMVRCNYDTDVGLANGSEGGGGDEDEVDDDDDHHHDDNDVDDDSDDDDDYNGDIQSIEIGVK